MAEYLDGMGQFKYGAVTERRCRAKTAFDGGGFASPMRERLCALRAECAEVGALDTRYR
ncbi:hypothetical protein ACFYRG_22075 [Streptomyces mirabilis]|uniref:hypothetical protein n=1 Tax=Streptomyces mirabilis TaxID=68239 RepID=UPI0036AC2175